MLNTNPSQMIANKPKKVLYKGEKKEYSISDVTEIINWVLFQKNIYNHTISIIPDMMKIYSPETLTRMKALGHIDNNFNNEVTMGINIEVQIDSNCTSHNYNMLLRNGKKELVFSQSDYDNLIKYTHA